ncbi:hypothetical protein ACFQV2_36530 [Actinokineospora soli]|uniref:Uncharacterized protein n=1 Tax=Actinokineospora soli TaxID=1048753 RepID=A0ABW2TWE5_9PSEU
MAELWSVLSDQRAALAVDGQALAGLGSCLDLWSRLEADGVAPSVRAAVAAPLRGLRQGFPLAVLRESIILAVAHGQMRSVIDLFNGLLAAAEDSLAEVRAAPDLDEFHERIYAATPPIMSVVAVADVLCEPDVPLGDATVEKIKDKRRVWEEYRVRLMDAVDYHVRNITSRDVVWNGHVALVRAARDKGGDKAARRVVTRLVEQLLLYPAALGPRLVAEAG